MTCVPTSALHVWQSEDQWGYLLIKAEHQPLCLESIWGTSAISSLKLSESMIIKMSQAVLRTSWQGPELPLVVQRRWRWLEEMHPVSSWFCTLPTQASHSDSPEMQGRTAHGGSECLHRKPTLPFKMHVENLKLLPKYIRMRNLSNYKNLWQLKLKFCRNPQVYLGGGT